MTRKRTRAIRKPIEKLTRRVSEMDERVIDELYGLEPIYRPEEMIVDRTQPAIFITVKCPYCAEAFDTQVDLTAGSFTHIEDCQVCCQPIELHVEVDDAGRLRAIYPERMN